MRFVDSHLHLDGPDALATLEFAKSAGALVIACGVDRASSERLLELEPNYQESLAPFVGVHPSEAEKNAGFSWLEDACKSAAGIGEIGLDPTYSPVAKGSAQMESFEVQVELDEKFGKPVEVHSRQAEGLCVEILSQAGLSRVLMHWLESEDTLPAAMEHGYYISFGPALLYSKRLQRIAQKADPSLILLETDSPVAYGPLGGVAGPMLVPSVAFKLAEVTGRGFESTLDQCNRNSLRFLGRSKG